MRWTVEEVARALGVTPPGGSIPWPGWPVSRLILGPWLAASCSSRYTDRVTTDTILSSRLWTLARWRRSSRKDRVSGFAEPFAPELFAVADTLAALQGTRASRSNPVGAAPGGGHRIGGKDHNEGNSGGAAGRAVPRLEIRGQSEQRIRLAAAIAAARGCGRGGRRRTGHVARRRIAALGGDCAPGSGRGHARRARASGIFRVGG